MARCVVILGAGASADFGVPTLPIIFKDRSGRSYLNSKPELLKMLNDIFWHPRGHDLESSDQSLTIEQMLTILKDLEKEPSIPQQSRPQNMEAFKKGLLVLIQKAVFEGKSSKGRHLNPLIDICNTGFDHTTWASFNWDCVFEASFWYSSASFGGHRVNPKLAIDIQNWYGTASCHTYLKLHGGVNWWLINDQVTYVNWTGAGELEKKWFEYDTNPNFKERPVILEPSFYKYEDSAYKQLGPQWQVFLKDMLNADCIIVVGYSFPEMDVNARSRILTAFQVNDKCRWLVVNPSDGVCGLYRSLLGNDRTKIVSMTLAGFNNEIQAHFQDAFPGIGF